MMAFLNSYLLQHKSLSIPGLGTIYVERIPAQIDFINRQMLPPVYHFRFNKYFDTPDKEFFSYLANQKNIQDYEAIKWYNEWAHELKNKIRNQNEVYWDGVGVLKNDITGEIIFEAASPVRVHFNPVPAERVIRADARHTMLVGDREITNKEMTGYLTEESNYTYIEKESWWVYASIVAAIIFIILFFHFYKHGLRFDSITNQQTINVRN